MYTIQQVSKLAGISTRTLRYYHEKELLIPHQSSENNYRLYNEKDIDTLQQILFYKELGLSLEDIKFIICDNAFDVSEALISHKKHLLERKKRINTMIKTINQTLDSIEGGTILKTEDKFKGLKEKEIEKNEKKYGKEVRETYGEEVVEQSNKKFMKMTKKDYKDAEELGKVILDTLGDAIKTNDPSNEISQQVCEYHEKWIKYYWPTYSKEAHLGLVKMYTEDERFAKYYAVSGENAANYLYKAMKIYLS